VKPFHVVAAVIIVDDKANTLHRVDGAKAFFRVRFAKLSWL